jgi:hypothetical protein
MILSIAPPKPMNWQLWQGHSATFQSLRSRIKDVLHHNDQSIVLGWRQELRDRLAEIVIEAAESNWDGYGASCLSESSIWTARYLIDLLPETSPLPDLVPCVDGEISFEWDRGLDHIFSIKTYRGLIVYAGILGRDRQFHGQEPMGDELPLTIRTTLATYFPKT